LDRIGKSIGSDSIDFDAGAFFQFRVQPGQFAENADLLFVQVDFRP
jgi:hypothetical protein